eukprot:179600-Amphidinium_carterae.1
MSCVTPVECRSCEKLRSMPFSDNFALEVSAVAKLDNWSAACTIRRHPAFLHRLLLPCAIRNPASARDQKKTPMFTWALTNSEHYDPAIAVSGGLRHDG